jgi:hypothetical protein
VARIVKDRKVSLVIVGQAFSLLLEIVPFAGRRQRGAAYHARPTARTPEPWWGNADAFRARRISIRTPAVAATDDGRRAREPGAAGIGLREAPAMFWVAGIGRRVTRGQRPFALLPSAGRSGVVSASSGGRRHDGGEMQRLGRRFASPSARLAVAAPDNALLARARGARDGPRRGAGRP